MCFGHLLVSSDVTHISNISRCSLYSPHKKGRAYELYIALGIALVCFLEICLIRGVKDVEKPALWLISTMNALLIQHASTDGGGSISRTLYTTYRFDLITRDEGTFEGLIYANAMVLWCLGTIIILIFMLALGAVIWYDVPVPVAFLRLPRRPTRPPPPAFEVRDVQYDDGRPRHRAQPCEPDDSEAQQPPPVVPPGSGGADDEEDEDIRSNSGTIYEPYLDSDERSEMPPTPVKRGQQPQAVAEGCAGSSKLDGGDSVGGASVGGASVGGSSVGPGGRRRRSAAKAARANFAFRTSIPHLLAHTKEFRVKFDANGFSEIIEARNRGDLAISRAAYEVTEMVLLDTPRPPTGVSVEWPLPGEAEMLPKARALPQ